MMTQKEILELALTGAIDVWADFRFLAGLDATDACFNYRCTASDAKLREAKEEMDAWSKKVNWLKAQIGVIEAEEKAVHRAKRKRIKQSNAA